MNLIEQLGGYEKAKAFLNATSFTIDELIMMQRSGLRTQHVEKALLEYRRQHNIYEVEDKIIVDWDARQIFTVDLVFPEIRLISALDSSGNKVGNASFDRIRHATPEEIAAGRRLP